MKHVLLSLVNQLMSMSVKWFTHNQHVPRIILSESGKGHDHLQSEALSIFNICCNHGISIEMKWISRSQNDQSCAQIFLVAFMTWTIGAFRLFLSTELTCLT